jgi:hypothetical protein
MQRRLKAELYNFLSVNRAALARAGRLASLAADEEPRYIVWETDLEVRNKYYVSKHQDSAQLQTAGDSGRDPRVVCAIRAKAQRLYQTIES